MKSESTESMLVTENEVLIAAARWLFRRNVFPYQFSVAHGKGIDYSSNQDILIDELRLQEIIKQLSLPRFEGHGPDILGLDTQSLQKVIGEQEINPENSEWWQIECKGAGKGKPPTQRNNFDRGLASVVSYYGPSQEFKNAKPYLGFALPNTFKEQLKTRLRRPLRKVLNLWVLIYDPDDESVHAVPPDAEYT